MNKCFINCPAAVSGGENVKSQLAVGIIQGEAGGRYGHNSRSLEVCREAQ